MSEETPSKETRAAPTEPKELSQEDLEKVAGGSLPIPMTRVITPVEGLLPVADLPGPMPDTFERRFVKR